MQTEGINTEDPGGTAATSTTTTTGITNEPAISQAPAPDTSAPSSVVEEVPAHQSAVNDTSPAQADSATPMVWMSEQIRERVQAELAAHLPTPPPSNPPLETPPLPSEGMDSKVDSSTQDVVEATANSASDANGKEAAIVKSIASAEGPRDTGKPAEAVQSGKGKGKRKAEAQAADGTPPGRTLRSQFKKADAGPSEMPPPPPRETRSASARKKGEEAEAEEKVEVEGRPPVVPATIYRPRKQRWKVERVPVSLGMEEINRRTRRRGALILTGAVSPELLADLTVLAQSEALRKQCEREMEPHASSNVYRATTTKLAPDDLKGPARPLMDRVINELAIQGIDVRHITCVASMANGGIETPHYDAPYREEPGHVGVLAVLPGTYMLMYVGYKGTGPGGRMEQVHFQPGEILYTTTDQPYGGAPYGDFMSYWIFYDVDETEIVPEYVYPGDELGSREELYEEEVEEEVKAEQELADAVI